MSTIVPIYLPFDQADPAGIMFFGEFPVLCHRALEQALPQWGIEWKTWYGSDFGSPIRHIEVDYKSPLYPGKTYDFSIQLVKMGKTSIQFVHQARLQNENPAQQSSILAEARITHVFIDRKMKSKIPIPEILIQNLKKILDS